jgi:REP element-mobilizing transposase RayT
MPDHFHWLITINGSRPLSVSVNTVKSWATRRINRLAGFTGRLWSPGFYDRAIRKEEDLGAVARYIVANPLRAGLVRSIRDYPHWDAKWL